MKPPAVGSIVVFGEALLDEFAEQKLIGGAPFNVARNLAHFNCATLMISRIGKDPDGELIRADMHRCGMTQIGMQEDATHATGRVLVTQDKQENTSSHRFTILPDQAYDYINSAQAQQAVNAFCLDHPARFLYFGSLVQRSVCSRLSLQALLDDSKALRYLDLNLRDGQVSASTITHSLHLADIVKVNEDELLHLLQLYPSTTGSVALDLAADRLSWKPAIDALMSKFELQAVIITLGANGYAYFDTQGRYFSASSFSSTTPVIDTVGGGDAFSAVFLSACYYGWPLATGLRRAHEFASAVCGIRGAVSSDPDFFKQWMQRWAAESFSGERS
ncbi:PfkB family carbohydrate kinase [Undibacterium sp. Ren11W]|uniref:PfkB family carbohydrate kinase n=1 Tax=Undibacterium sp. Ren11W TaxID=3413045 RepID=UPI003BF23FEE